MLRSSTGAPVCGGLLPRASPDLRTPRACPMHRAAATVPCVRLLLDARASVDLTDAGALPLRGVRREQAALLLLEHSAEGVITRELG